jgi:hypothetical protein
LALRWIHLLLLGLGPARNEHLTPRWSWAKALSSLTVDTGWRWVACFTLRPLLFGNEPAGIHWVGRCLESLANTQTGVEKFTLGDRTSVFQPRSLTDFAVSPYPRHALIYCFISLYSEIQMSVAT